MKRVHEQGIADLLEMASFFSVTLRSWMSFLLVNYDDGLQIFIYLRGKVA